MDDMINSNTSAQLRALLIYNSDHDILAADYWHKLWGWKRHSIKQIHCSELAGFEHVDGIKRFWIRYHYDFYAPMCFDELMDAFFHPKPSEILAQASTDCNTEYPMSAYALVMYEQVPGNLMHTPEAIRIQAEIEDCLFAMSTAESRREANQKGLKSILRKKREESARNIAEATAIVNQKIEEFDRLKKQYFAY